MHLWHYDGQVFPTIGLNAVAGKPPEEWGMDPVRYEDMIPGCYDPVARVEDMDLDGVQAALCFPSFPGFGGGTFPRQRQGAGAAVRARRGTTSTSTSGAGPRPTGSSRWRSCRSGTSTCAWPRPAGREKGARTISFPDSPVPLGLPSFHTDHWDPLWALCAETDTPVSLHFGSGSFVPGFSFIAIKPTAKEMAAASDAAPFAVPTILFSSNLMWTTVDLLFSGALQKFPNLTFSLAEGGIGWIPYILERSDYTWDRHRWYQDIDKEARPSDLFREALLGLLHRRRARPREPARHRHRPDHLEIDFPHSDSNWPNSRKRAAEVLADVPDDEVELIVETNARRMLHFPRGDPAGVDQDVGQAAGDQGHDYGGKQLVVVDVGDGAPPSSA
jgi:hypothetical protein